MFVLMLYFICFRTTFAIEGFSPNESSKFPLEDCFSQEMDILMLFYDNGDLSDNIDQYTTSQHLFQHLLSSPYNKTTSRVLYTYVFDTFSETNLNIDINSWYFHTSLETLTNNSVRTDKHSFISTSGTQAKDVLVPKIKFVRRFFSEMSGVREYATHIAVIFLDGTSLSYDEGRKIPSIIQQQNTDIKIFVVVHGGKYDQERKYFSDTIFLEKNVHVTTNYILVMAICKQCMQGWFPFEHTGSSDYLSCYQLLDSNLQISWYEAMRTCNVQFGGHLAAIETHTELTFLQKTLLSYLKDLKNNNLHWYNTTELIVKVYIGLNRDKNAARRFEWSLRSPSSNRPLVTNNWLDGKPSGGYDTACGVWQFDWHDRKNDSIFWRNQDYFVEGWSHVRCRVKLSRFSLCEITLSRASADTHMRIDPASRESFNKSLDKGGYVVFSTNIVSISANSGSTIFLKFLQEKYDKIIPLFDCMEESGNPRYISYSYVCDNINHCNNKRDESPCYLSQRPSSTCMFGPHLESDMSGCDDIRTCDNRYKKCEDQCSGIYCCDGSCLSLQLVNDGEIDCNICGYSSGRSINDESEIFNNFLQKNITCALICNQNKCVRFSQLNDGRNDCRGPEGPLDETIGKLESAETCRNILDHIIWAPRCVYVKDMYGAVIGCRDMSHLRNCTDFMCPEGYVKCPDTYCIPQHYVLDGKVDCPTGDEENHKNIDSCSGNFVCWNSTVCLHPALVCDGHPDCPNQDDEVDCTMHCMHGFHCVSGTITVSDYNISVTLRDFSFSGTHFKYIDLSGVNLSVMLQIHAGQLLIYVFVNWSRCNLKNLPWIQEMDYPVLIQLDLDYSSVKTYNDKCQPTLGNLRHFNLSYNNELVVKYFNLPFLEVLDLSHTAQSYIDYDFLIRLPMLRHLNLSFTLISSVHKQSFSSQYNLQTLDLRGIPFDNFNEDLFNGLTISQHMYADQFEMCCSQIRGHNIPDYTCHVPEDKISSCYDLLRDNVQRVTLLVIAVLAVLENVTLIVYRVLCDRSALRTAYGQFVTNLCISDLITGIYVCIIVGADYKYREVYALYNKSWRESLVCKLAGFLATLSSETSIYFIFLSTFNIFLKKQMTRMQIIIAVILSWTLCFLLALLPLVLKFDIYSSNSICLGLPITKQVFKDGWEYSFCLFIAHNLCIVLAVAYGQKVILRSMSKNTISNITTISSSNRPQDKLLAKQLSLVAFLTCLTWFYIGITGLLSLGEHGISNEVYASTTVIILPLHSAANPILYTIPAMLARWEKFKHGQ